VWSGAIKSVGSLTTFSDTEKDALEISPEDLAKFGFGFEDELPKDIGKIEFSYNQIESGKIKTTVVQNSDLCDDKNFEFGHHPFSSLYCIDETRPLTVSGTYFSQNFKYLKFEFLPCY
jgi:hypothetical protein